MYKASLSDTQCNISGPKIAASVLNIEAAINIGINGIKQEESTSKKIETPCLHLLIISNISLLKV